MIKGENAALSEHELLSLVYGWALTRVIQAYLIVVQTPLSPEILPALLYTTLPQLKKKMEQIQLFIYFCFCFRDGKFQSCKM